MPSPPGRGLSHGLMFHPVKKDITTETRHTLIKMAVRLEEKGGGLMGNGAWRGKVRVSNVLCTTLYLQCYKENGYPNTFIFFLLLTEQLGVQPTCKNT